VTSWQTTPYASTVKEQKAHNKLDHKTPGFIEAEFQEQTIVTSVETTTNLQPSL
jgi:hypothetical protein